MTAGELTGWVFISSSPARRFYVSAKFALSGAGGDYNLSYQTTGDTPPAGFLVDITTTGMIRVTLPASSGSTSVINYALNAPAIGASFPLTVNASQVQGRTDGSAVASGYVGEVVEAIITTTNLTTSEADVTGAILTLSAGIWEIKYYASINVTTGVSVNNTTQAVVKITDAASNTLARTSQVLYVKNTGTGGTFAADHVSTIAASKIVNISTSSTYKLRAFRSDLSGTGSASVNNSTSSTTAFFAVRIA
jgi:hypothetical protein